MVPIVQLLCTIDCVCEWNWNAFALFYLFKESAQISNSINEDNISKAEKS